MDTGREWVVVVVVVVVGLKTVTDLSHRVFVC